MARNQNSKFVAGKLSLRQTWYGMCGISVLRKLWHRVFHTSPRSQTGVWFRRYNDVGCSLPKIPHRVSPSRHPPPRPHQGAQRLPQASPHLHTGCHALAWDAYLVDSDTEVMTDINSVAELSHKWPATSVRHPNTSCSFSAMSATSILSQPLRQCQLHSKVLKIGLYTSMFNPGLNLKALQRFFRYEIPNVWSGQLRWPRIKWLLYGIR